MLDGSSKLLVQRVSTGDIIRRFEKTPYPVKGTDVVCPHFLELCWSWGCPYDCKWCYLKGTYRYFLNGKTGCVLPHFKDRKRIKRVCQTFINSNSPPEILNSGELSDSLMGEALKEPWSVFIQEIFRGTKHKVLHLTKGTYVRNFLRNDWQKNAILSWTINEPSVSKKWEVLAPDPIQRLQACKKVSEAGYEARLRIDPIVPVKEYQVKYRQLIDEIFRRLWPERITLGTLRGLRSTLGRTRNHSWKNYLQESSNWGKKPAFEVRYEMYRNLIKYLKNEYDFVRVGICKETLGLWKTLQLRFDEIHCNCI